MMASPLLLFLGYRSTTTQDEAIGEVATEVDLEEVIKPS
jgi:hypothetical protein